MDEDVARAAWHRILLASSLGYFLFASGVRPPYAYSDLVPGIPVGFEVLFTLCGVLCVLQVVMYRLTPLRTEWLLICFLLVVWGIRASVLFAVGAIPAATGSMMIAGYQYGLYAVIMGRKAC